MTSTPATLRPALERPDARLLGAVVAHVLAPLAAGGAVYLARARSLWMYRWAEAAHAGAVVDGLRAAAAPLRALPDWIRFSLPDALFVYALTWALARTWRGSGRVALAAALAGAFALGPGLELAQAAAWVPGTFDVVDLALALVAYVAAATAVLASPPRGPE